MHQIGDVLAGKYRLVRTIGKGGMGEVFEAMHEELGKRFAVKIPTEELMTDQQNLERFKREPKVAAATGHRCIVDVYDIGLTAKGIPFVVMELLEGEAFSTFIRREVKVDLSMATYIIAQVLSALSAAHSKGIIHRDLKPDNVYLVDSGQPLPDVKLLDFGTSKVVAGSGAEARSLTQSGTILGTPYYMAPEQVKANRKLDRRLDVYAAGVMLYEALTGMVPFESDNVYSLVHMVLHEELVPPRVYRGDLPEGLEQVILKAMNRNRAVRFESAEAMLRALLPFMDDMARLRIWVPEALRSSEPSLSSPLSRRSALSAPSDPSSGQTRPEDIGQSPTLPNLERRDEDLVLGRYAPLKRLVRGRTGTIYLARTEGGEGFRKPVAIKLIHPHLLEDKAAVRYFVNEAKLAARITHPNVVEVMDFGEHNGQYLSVMEYVHGYHAETIAQYLASTQRPLSVQHAAYVFYRVLQGVGYAHGLTDDAGEPLGLVHGGLSPDSIRVSTDGNVKVTGFGVGHALSASAGEGGADFAYKTPEEVNGEPVDNRSDLFVIGIILYETLTGYPLFGSGGDAITVMRVSKADVPNIRNIRPDLPPEMAEVLSRALARDPIERYFDASDFAADLRFLMGADPEAMELSFRSLVSETISEESFVSSVGQLFELPPALAEEPIVLDAPTVVHASDEPAEVPVTGRRSPIKFIIAIAAAVLLLAGGAVAAAFFMLQPENGGGGSRRPVALIIDKQGDSSGANPNIVDSGIETQADEPLPMDTAEAGDIIAADLNPPSTPEKVVQPPVQKLTGRVVTRTLMKNQGRLVQCFRRNKATSSGAKITAINVTIMRNGTVRSATVEPAAVNSTPLGRCVAGVARSTRFPRHPHEGATIRIPISLE